MNDVEVAVVVEVAPGRRRGPGDRLRQVAAAGRSRRRSGPCRRSGTACTCPFCGTNRSRWPSPSKSTNGRPAPGGSNASPASAFEFESLAGVDEQHARCRPRRGSRSCRRRRRRRSRAFRRVPPRRCRSGRGPRPRTRRRTSRSPRPSAARRRSRTRPSPEPCVIFSSSTFLPGFSRRVTLVLVRGTGPLLVVGQDAFAVHEHRQPVVAPERQRDLGRARRHRSRGRRRRPRRCSVPACRRRRGC